MNQDRFKFRVWDTHCDRMRYEEDFFKYLMLSVALDQQEQEIQNLLDKYDRLQRNN